MTLTNGDSCCGGGFSFSVFNWFDIDDDNIYGDAPGMFGWEETVFDLSVDIGTNVTLLSGISWLDEGLRWIKMGVMVEF